MCNKCQNYHIKLFQQNHQIYKLDKNLEEIFTGYCKEKAHNSMLDFFCKNHNKLCCSSCLLKRKTNKYGQHADCEVVQIEDIKDAKKNILNENIQKLEILSKNINESIKKLKKIFTKRNENKEDLKKTIQIRFTKIRKALNDKEEEIISNIDKKFDELYLKEDLIKESEKISNKIEILMKKGKKINEEWNDENKLSLIINNCINLENNIKNLNSIEEKINNYNKNNYSQIESYIEYEKNINLFLDNIKTNISLFYHPIFKSSKIIDKITYIESVINWINKGNINCELLYRLTDDGDDFSTFHQLCDNKCPILILFHLCNGNKIGIYTPLFFDSNTNGWKEDKETFIFNLNQNKKFQKKRKIYSLYCSEKFGPYTEFLGCHSNCKNMKKIIHHKDIIYAYENGNEILPSDNQTKYYYILEIEVFHILYEDRK